MQFNCKSFYFPLTHNWRCWKNNLSSLNPSNEIISIDFNRKWNENVANGLLLLLSFICFIYLLYLIAFNNFLFLFYCFCFSNICTNILFMCFHLCICWVPKQSFCRNKQRQKIGLNRNQWKCYVGIYF